MQLVWLAVAGAIGTISRYYLSGWVYALFGTRLPYGTLVVNVLGSFLITLIMGIALQVTVSSVFRIALTVGFLGALTTFSTFTYETLNLIERGAYLAALFNLVLNCGLGLSAGWIGLIVGRTVVRGLS